MQHKKFGYQSLLFFIIAFTIQVLVWFVLYPTAGYNPNTLSIAQFSFILVTIVLFFLYRVSWQTIGILWKSFILAVGGISFSYLLIILLLALLNACGLQYQVLRQTYRLDALLNNWLLTGFGEELFFAGLLFNRIARSQKKPKGWLTVMLTAVAFALWHLPGYLGVGLRMGTLNVSILFDLLLNLISWCFFGTIYLLSGNLWLTAFVHASTDYALLPVIVSNPLLGLLFMLLNILTAYFLKKKSSTSSLFQYNGSGSIKNR
jgi:membrane protease YdiL (CAAX protease family)